MLHNCPFFYFPFRAIPFFIIAAICILGICVLYCRPVWRGCLFGNRCPCENRTRSMKHFLSLRFSSKKIFLVISARPVPPQTNPVFVLHNDDLPDYETITKDTPVKDFTPPPYNFVATHPTDFGIDTRVPSAPPQYSSRRTSVSSSTRDVPTN